MPPERCFPPVLPDPLRKSAEPFGVSAFRLSARGPTNCGGEDRRLLRRGWTAPRQPHMAMVHVRNYRPLYVIDQYGVMQYVAEPVLAVVPDLEPTAALKSRVEPGLISPSN